MGQFLLTGSTFLRPWELRGVSGLCEGHTVRRFNFDFHPLCSEAHCLIRIRSWVLATKDILLKYIDKACWCHSLLRQLRSGIG